MTSSSYPSKVMTSCKCGGMVIQVLLSTSFTNFYYVQTKCCLLIVHGNPINVFNRFSNTQSLHHLYPCQCRRQVMQCPFLGSVCHFIICFDLTYFTSLCVPIYLYAICQLVLVLVILSMLILSSFSLDFFPKRQTISPSKSYNWVK